MSINVTRVNLKRKRESEPLNSRKRRYYKPYSKPMNKMTFKPQLPLGLSPNHFCKLKYVEQTSIDATLGTRAAYVWQLNSLFDPNFTGTGHQPLGYDQLMLLYTHYEVKYAKITVTFSNTTSTAGLWVGITISRTTDTITSADTELYENAWTKRKLLNGNSVPCVVSFYVNIKAFLGRMKTSSPDSLRGISTTSPSEIVAAHVWCQALNSGVDPASIDVSATINFGASFGEPVRLGSS